MKKYTHRMKVDKKEIENIDDRRYLENKNHVLIDKYWRDGYMYGYLADGVLLGDLLEFDNEYVIFEYWWRVDDREVEQVK